jgi:hypothetical protein
MRTLGKDGKRQRGGEQAGRTKDVDESKVQTLVYALIQTEPNRTTPPLRQSPTIRRTLPDRARKLILREKVLAKYERNLTG